MQERQDQTFAVIAGLTRKSKIRRSQSPEQENISFRSGDGGSLSAMTVNG